MRILILAAALTLVAQPAFAHHKPNHRDFRLRAEERADIAIGRSVVRPSDAVNCARRFARRPTIRTCARVAILRPGR
jgi:hypothetical protein